MRIIKLFKYTSDFKSNFRAWEAYAIVIFITKTNHYFFFRMQRNLLICKLFHRIHEQLLNFLNMYLYELSK